MMLRLATAAVAIPALLGILWLGTPAVAALVLIVAGVGGWELVGMAWARTTSPQRWLRPIFWGWPVAFVVSGWLIAEDLAGWSALLAAFGIGFVPALAMLVTGRRRAFLYAIAAGPYVGIALAHAPMMRSADDGAQWLILVLIVTFAADSAAMLVGMAIGRHRLAPRISPAKTWEGAVGGLLGGAAAAVAIDAVFDLEIASGMAIVLGMVMAVAGTLGDLGESILKRHAGAKDSGFLIPGHGGVLDRLDSLMPNLIIVYWVSEWSAT